MPLLQVASRHRLGGLRHHCNACNTSFSVTVGTIFHDTKLDVQKWFLAISLILDAKKGISARQLGRHLEVNKNTAWYMGMRIRRALIEDGKLLRGIVEMDETYIGGKPRKGSDTRPDGPRKRGRGTNKPAVVGMVERGGSVRAQVSVKLNSARMAVLVRRNIDCKNSVLMTDAYPAYFPMARILPHKSVDHQFAYVNGDIHTNSIEGFWALLKRGIVGQYHKVSRKHLQKYVNEFAFRYNHRKDADMFDRAMERAVGA
jgi:hypothetical protein